MNRKYHHLHRYKKINIGRKPNDYLVFRCTKPDCNHYIRVELADGKLCECNRCSSPMIMNKVAMTLTLPHCLTCTKSKSKKKDKLDAISQFLNQDDSSQTQD